MARAVCSSCGKDVWWSSRRGSRLADVFSACCRATCKMPGDGVPSKNKGRSYAACARCKRKRLGVTTMEQPYRDRGFELQPAGAALCPWCRSDVRVPCGLLGEEHKPGWFPVAGIWACDNCREPVPAPASADNDSPAAQARGVEQFVAILESLATGKEDKP